MMTCPHCGSPLPQDGSPCPHCLMELALGETLVSGPDNVAPALPPDAPATIGPYRLLSVLGQGGMGTVYLADQVEPLRRRVALKLIRAGLAGGDVLARFETERQALARMSHPGIARVLDAGSAEDGSPYFVMEYVDGEPISTFCDRRQISTTERLALFRQVCDAVQHAHQRGILHRDLKPSNILVEEVDGVARPRVIDFGLAKALDQRLTERTLFTERGQIVGTPEYMSPEQAAGEAFDVDTTTDVYSLGVVLYELLTGALPHDPRKLRAAGWLGMMKMLREEEPKKPSTQISTFNDETASAVAARRKTEPRSLRRSLEGDLDWILLKALEKERVRRYATVSALAADLERHLRHEPVDASPPSRRYRMRKFVRRHRGGVAATAAVAAALLIGLVVTSLLLVEVRRGNDRNRTLVRRFAVESGMSLVDTEHPGDALPWLLGAWRLDAGDPRLVVAHRVRVAETVARLPTLAAIWFHGGNVRRALFGRDSRLAATVSEDGTVEVRRVTDGLPICPTLRHEAGVVAADFSPGGELLATASRDRTVRVWDLARCVASPAPLEHPQPVRDVVFRPDGTALLTACDDGIARLWEIPSGKLLLELRTGEPLARARFNSDGTHLATGSTGGQVRLWQNGSAEPVDTEMRHAAAIYTLQFSPDGSRLATASADGTARLWDGSTGEPRSAPLRHAREVDHLVFDRLGERLATASLDSTVRIWRASDGEALGSPLQQDNVAVMLAFDEEDRLAVAVWGGGVRLWSLEEETPKLELALPHAGAQVVSFDREGRFLLSAADDGSVKLWDTAVQSRPGRRSFATAAVRDLAFSPDGQLLGIAAAAMPPSQVGYAEVIDMETGDRVGLPVPHEGGARAFAFSANGEWGATAGSADGAVKVWRIRDTQPLVPTLAHSGPLTSVDFSPDGMSLLAAEGDPATDSGAAHLWQLPDGQEMTPAMRHAGRVARALFSPDGRRIATASWDGTAQIWDAESHQPIWRTPPGQVGYVNDVAFSPDGRVVATAGPDHSARLWDAASGRPLAPPLAHGGPIFRVAFSGDGQLLATSSADGSARVWRVADGQLQASPLEHHDLVHTARFSPDGRWLITASADRSARIWEVATGLPLTPQLRLEGPVRVALFSPDGSRYAIGGPGVLVDSLLSTETSLEQLEALAAVLSGQRFDPRQGVVSLSASELRAAAERWSATVARAPQR